jgi:nitrate reductase gamma subunit
MQRPNPHFSRPVYEGLPWLYIIFGLGALMASYLLARGTLSLLVGVLGLACVVGGFALLLRRRDYRALRSQYADPDSLSADDKP